jgi:hypothetical protein
MRMRWITLAAVAASVLINGCSSKPKEVQATERMVPIEGFPSEVIDKLEAKKRALESAKRPGGMRPFFFYQLTKRWGPGEVVTVAFNGGSLDLQREIVRIAATWTLYANLGLDFGYDANKKTFRNWSEQDVERKAQIRIGFNRQGYWSCVGTDSSEDDCAPANRQSMNFGGFNEWRPQNWQAVVLHEFGHALGFQHEHQSPKGGCEAEFRWDDAPGYVPTQDSFGQFIQDNAGRRPGVYTVLGGSPNRWDKRTIDFNLRQLPDSNAFEESALDNLSIMKYEFPDWMYKSGRSSPCFSTRNDDLSELDREGASALYPRDPHALLGALRDQKAVLSSLNSISGLGSDQTLAINKRLDSVIQLIK